MLTFTRKAYLEVWRDGRYISRHQGLLEAGESASRDADEHGSGDYEIRIGAEVYYMARADVTIFSSTSQPAFARPAGAKIGANTSAVAAGASSSIDASVVLTSATTAAAAGVSAVSGGPRTLDWTIDFESGRTYSIGTVGTDAINIRQSSLLTSNAINITNITKANPAVISYTGANPTSNSPHGADGLLVQGVNGMTAINGLMIRPHNVNTSNKTFQVRVDHIIPGSISHSAGLGTINLDTTLSKYNAYTNGGTLTPFRQDDDSTRSLNSTEETRIIANSDTLNGNIITPRTGNYMLKMTMLYNYDYSIFDGNSGKNKPRINGNPGQYKKFLWDEERWIGFSIFLPLDYVDDIPSGPDLRDNEMFGMAAPGADTYFKFGPRPFSNGTRWLFQWTLNPTSTTDKDTNTQWFEVDCGLVTKGVWTDIVIRHRWNPFTSNTTISGITYQGNKGILQAWLGNSGNMTRYVNLVNQPIGLRPFVDQVNNDLSYTFRQYKHGWHAHSTATTDPIIIYYDAIRQGLASNGTGFADVHPDQMAQP